MPLSTELPAPSIELEAEYVLPAAFFTQQSFTGQVCGFGNIMPRIVDGATTLPSNTTAPRTFVTYKQVNSNGGAGPFGTVLFGLRHGRRSMRIEASGNAGAYRTDDWRPPDWLPMVGDPDGPNGMAPGAMLLPGSVCAWFDWNLCAELAGAVATWPADITGVFFAPSDADDDAIPGNPGKADVEGAGVFLNPDGAGGMQYEWLSWGAGAPGPILERTAIAGLTVTDWNTFRFIFVSGASGRQPTLTLQVNGVDALTREYGSAQLDRLNTSFPNTTGPLNKLAVGQGTDAMHFQMVTRLSRYTPTGEELQGQ